MLKKITSNLGRLSIAFFSFDQITLAIGYDFLSKIGSSLIFSFIVFALTYVSIKRHVQFNMKIRSLIFSFLFFIFISAISVFSSDYALISLERLLQFSFLTCWILFIYIFREIIDFDKTLKLSVIIALISIFIVLISRPDLFFSADSAAKRLIFEGLGINAISINIGYLIILSCFFLIDEKATKLIRMTTVLFLALSILFIMKTGTRSVVIGIPLSLFSSYLIVYRGAISLRNVFLIVLSILIGVVLILNSGLIDDRLLDRVLVGSDDFTDNVRISIWYTALDWYANNLLGSGFGTEWEVFGLGSVGEAHNTFISVIIQTSFFGFIFFCMIFIFIAQLNIETKSLPIIKFIFWSIFVFLVLQLFKGTFHHTRLFFVPIAWLLLMHDSRLKSYILTNK